MWQGISTRLDVAIVSYALLWIPAVSLWQRGQPR
jgi:hypothetical protein